MKTNLTSLLALPLIFSISACDSLMHPDIQKNPHPKMRYEVTMTIEGAPGPFESVNGHMQYDISNERCSPEDKLTGVYLVPPTQRLPIALVRTGNGVYTATIYTDAMKDDDYYGKGVCHWALTAFTASLKIHGSTLIPGINSDEVSAQKPSVNYFGKEAFTDTHVQDLVVPGIPYSLYSTAADQSVFFSVTMTAKENFR